MRIDTTDTTTPRPAAGLADTSGHPSAHPSAEPNGSRRPSPTDARQPAEPAAKRNPWQAARAAVDFWQALEYLAPQAPPAVGLDRAVFAFGADAPPSALPWHDAKLRAVLDRQVGAQRKFQLFAGIVGGEALIEAVRHALAPRRSTISSASGPRLPRASC